MKQPSTKTDIYFAYFFTILGALFLYLMWVGTYGLQWLRQLVTAVVVCVTARAWYYVLTQPENPAYQQAIERNEQDQRDFHEFVLAMDEESYWALCDQVLPEDFESYLFEIYEREAKPNGAKYAGKPLRAVHDKDTFS
ncbi:hypothetical protein [Spirosoma rigui]|uniref:hypothetical protein n=1 Tax=Spirosoma rigui TaxID=564064 RepID=UPI0009AFE15D|nr:hypothetical protein [Spirosoma rigui]